MRLGFHRRLFGALAVTLAVVGFVQYRVLAEETRNRLLDSQRMELSADAEGVETAYRTASIGEVPLNQVNRYLRAIAARRPGEEVTLVDPDKYIVAAPTVLGIGSVEDDPKVLESLSGEAGYAGPAGEESSAGMLFTTPVELPRGRHLLVVRQRSDVVQGPLDDLRRQLILVLIAGLALAIPAFYLLGGRSLGRLHRAAVDRATRDGLTDLGNHRAFQEQLQRAVAIARRHSDDLSLVLLDIDDFRFENDRHGNAHGDAILAMVAAALGAGRAEDLAFRVGGDEFAVILPRTDEESARAVLGRMTDPLRRSPGPNVSMSAGLATYGAATIDAQTLRDEADAALFEARKRGAGGTVSFREIEDLSEVVTAQKVRAVRRLLEEAAVTAAFQPMLSLEDGSVFAFEALARPEPGLGLAGPGEAFDVAIAIGRAAELDDLCRRAIFADAHLLPDGALLFVNVAPQALDGEQLSGDSLIRLADAAGLGRERVVLEITERFSGRVDRVVAEATRLRSLGFKLALDDVGAGNSGLEMLRDLAVDYVKIDRQVVSRAMTDPSARAVLTSVATFSRETGAYVIAEGIENDSMLEFVRGLDVEGDRRAVQGAQGYLLGRPAPLAAGPAESPPKPAGMGASMQETRA